MNSFEPFSDSLTNRPVFFQLVLILFLAMLGSFVAGILVQTLGASMGIDYTDTVQALTPHTPAKEKNFIKIALCISHICTFILPSLLYLWITYKQWNWTYLKLHRKPIFIYGLVGALLLVAAFPLVQFIFTLNKQLPLPQWAIEQEELINTTIKNLLIVDGTGALLFNLLTIAVLPSIGEELLFRGILQQNLEKGTQNPHLAIWLTALIFSFIHFQFQGFLPRIFLGALLGYLFVWTRNLWIPIIGHLVYNAGQILLQYFNQQGILGIDLNEVKVVPLWLVSISLLATLALSYFLYDRRKLEI